VEIEKEEKGARSRISLYIEKEKIKQIDDMRLLMALNGGNMESIPEFTDMIDALIIFSYVFSYPKIEERFLKQFTSEKSDNSWKYEEEEPSLFYEIMEEQIGPKKYEAPAGYIARMYSLKDKYRELIDRSIINIKETTSLTVNYSDFIKKSIEFVLDSSLFSTVKWPYFKYIYIGSLYNLSPETSLKFALFMDHNHISKEITSLEMKQIKLLNSDSRIITELIRILRETKDLDNKKQFDFLVDKLLDQKDTLKSILWNFNYADAFFGYVYSLIYLVSSFKSIIGFMEEIGLNDRINEILRSESLYKFTDASKGKTKVKKEAIITWALTEFIKDLQKFHGIAQLSLQFDVNDVEKLNEIKDKLRKMGNELFNGI